MEIFLKVRFLEGFFNIFLIIIIHWYLLVLWFYVAYKHGLNHHFVSLFSFPSCPNEHLGPEYTVSII